MNALYAAFLDLAAARDERNAAWSDRTLEDDTADELAADDRITRMRERWTCPACGGGIGKHATGCERPCVEPGECDE